MTTNLSPPTLFLSAAHILQMQLSLTEQDTRKACGCLTCSALHSWTTASDGHIIFLKDTFPTPLAKLIRCMNARRRIELLMGWAGLPAKPSRTKGRYSVKNVPTMGKYARR